MRLAEAVDVVNSLTTRPLKKVWDVAVGLPRLESRGIDYFYGSGSNECSVSFNLCSVLLMVTGGCVGGIGAFCWPPLVITGLVPNLAYLQFKSLLAASRFDHNEEQAAQKQAEAEKYSETNFRPN